MTGQGLPVRMMGRLAVAALPEEIDLLNVAQFQAELEALLGNGALVVDMSETRYCDSAGVAALVRVAKAARAAGVPLRVAVSDPVARVMRLLGAERVVDVYPSLAAALAAGQPAAAPPSRDGDS